MTGTLPAGVSFVSGAGCASATGGFTCHGTGLAAGGTDPYTVHVKVASSACPGTAPSCDGTAHASVSVASTGTTDPTSGNNGAGTSPDVSILTQADLVPSISAPSGNQIAGDPSGFNYSVSVKNNGLSDNHGGYTVTGTLPAGVSFVSGAGCASATGGFTCSNTGLAAGGTDPYTVHVKVAASACPGTAPSCDGTAHASVSVTSNGTADPTPGNNGPAGTSPDASIITRADLQPSITAPSGNKIAGDSSGFNYTVTVTNNGLSDNHGGYTLTGTLPAYMHWASGGDCSSAANGFTCTNTGGLVATSGSNVDTYHVHVTVDASACPGDPNATPACNGTAHASVSVASNGTTDPTSGNNGAGTSPDVSIITQADLEAQSMTSTASSLFANTAPANATTFTYQFTNHGLSDAQHVVISLPDHPLASANPTYFKIDNLCRVTGTVTCANTGDFGTGTDIGEVDAGATVTVVIHAHANAGLGHNSPDPIATGSFLVKSSATVASRTTDPGPAANVKNVLSPNVTISTVASPPRNPFGIPGTGNAILTWENPAGNGGQAIQNFLITVTPPVGSSFTLPTVPFNASPTSKCGAVNASDCYQLTVTGLQNDHGAYTFAIQAQNAVGPSDAATTTATPSVNAKNASVPTNTSTTLTTCTTATPTTPVCVVYNIPSGAGGVFGAGGLVALPTGLCGINVTCINNTGAQNLGSLAGYTDRTLPLIETITWDSSLIAPSFYTNVPACPNNSTATNCYPNNIPIYYEDTFTLLHCGVGLTGTCDPNTLIDHSLFPVVPGTILNLHFCAQATNSGGAGNKNYARPKPSPTRHLQRVQRPVR